MKFKVGDIIVFNEEGKKSGYYAKDHSFLVIKEVERFGQKGYQIKDLNDGRIQCIYTSIPWFTHHFTFHFQQFIQSIGGLNEV